MNNKSIYLGFTFSGDFQMKKTKLPKYLERKGVSQRALAAKLKLTQGAISAMVVKQKDITVTEHSNGVIELHEYKLIATSAESEVSN